MVIIINKTTIISIIAVTIFRMFVCMGKVFFLRYSNLFSFSFSFRRMSCFMAIGIARYIINNEGIESRDIVIRSVGRNFLSTKFWHDNNSVKNQGIIKKKGELPKIFPKRSRIFSFSLIIHGMHSEHIPVLLDPVLQTISDEWLISPPVSGLLIVALSIWQSTMYQYSPIPRLQPQDSMMSQINIFLSQRSEM